MKSYAVLLASVVALITLARPSPAAAAFTVCNSTTYGDVNVAYAATWHDSKGSSYGQSRGWWIIPQDDCKIIITNDISAYTVYIYAFATSDPANRWWGGSNNYCLDPNDKFLHHGDDMDTPCSSGRSFGMRFMDSGSNSTYTYYLYD